MLDSLLQSGLYADVVRESQAAAELILKGALRFSGIEPPKRHDVHRFLEQFIERFPQEWRPALAELRDGLDKLVADRASAFYGDEAGDIPASDLFGGEDARGAVAVVDRLLDLYTRLLGEKR